MFLKYVFDPAKPCLHNVKELVSDHRSEKNFAEAETVGPWSAKGSRVLFVAKATSMI